MIKNLLLSDIKLKLKLKLCNFYMTKIMFQVKFRMNVNKNPLSFENGFFYNIFNFLEKFILKFLKYSLRKT